jgi:hypothetical protein
MPERRFPPPWAVEEYRGISYIVRDANNFAMAYVYFESEPGSREAANLMTKDELVGQFCRASQIAKSQKCGVRGNRSYAVCSRCGNR